MLYKTTIGGIASAVLLLSATSIRVASGETISFVLTQSNQMAVPGGSVPFRGTVKNPGSLALNATDFFFDFAGFDPGAIAIAQDLGQPDFIIPGGSTTPVIDLFTVIVATTATLGQPYFIDSITLGDTLGRESLPLIASVTPTPQADSPEPGTFLLLGTGVTLVWLGRRRSRVLGRGTKP